MNKTKVLSSFDPSEPLVIQNVDAGFLPMENQYDLQYWVRLPYSPSSKSRLYRIFSATKEGSFFQWEIFIPITEQQSGMVTFRHCGLHNEQRQYSKSEFLKHTSSILTQISHVVKTFYEFLEAVKNERVFVVSFKDLLIFDKRGAFRLIPFVNSECYPEHTVAVDITQLGRADMSGRVRQAGSNMPPHYQKSISTDSAADNMQNTVQTNQRGQICQVGDLVPCNTIHLPEGPREIVKVPNPLGSGPSNTNQVAGTPPSPIFHHHAEQIQLVAAGSSFGHAPEEWTSAMVPERQKLQQEYFTMPGSRGDQRDQTQVQKPSEDECEVVLEVHKQIQGDRQASRPRLILPNLRKIYLDPNLSQQARLWWQKTQP